MYVPNGILHETKFEMRLIQECFIGLKQKMRIVIMIVHYARDIEVYPGIFITYIAMHALVINIFS